MQQLIQSANANLITNLLPVLDNLQRSFDERHGNSDDEDFRKGVELIFKNLQSVLKNAGLEPMQSVGEPFDVENHDALLQVEKEDVKSGMVIEEHEKGYLLNGKVIRHAKVLLSK